MFGKEVPLGQRISALNIILLWESNITGLGSFQLAVLRRESKDAMRWKISL